MNRGNSLINNTSSSACTARESEKRIHEEIPFRTSSTLNPGMGDPHQNMQRFKTAEPDRRNRAGTTEVLGPDKQLSSYILPKLSNSSGPSDDSCSFPSNINDNDYINVISSSSFSSSSIRRPSSSIPSSSTCRDSRKKVLLANHNSQHQNNWSKMMIIASAKKESSFCLRRSSRRARDPLLMGSCETTSRTIIDPDAKSGVSGDADKITTSSSFSFSITRNKFNDNRNVNNANNKTNSNYKSCTELITTIIWKTVVIVWMMMIMAISKFRKQQQQPPKKQNQHQPLHFNYNLHRHNRLNNNCLRTFIVSVILFLMSCFNTPPLVHGQPPPLPPAGFLDFDNLPVTRFSCEGKVIGGYYADVETGCQMFHVCTLGQKDEIQDIKFLCLNGTVFDQETRVCERVDEVDCNKAEQFFDLNLDLYVSHATTQKPEDADLEEEDDVIGPVQAAAGTSLSKSSKNNNNPPSPSSTTRQTTTTTTPTPSPRTRPPTTPSSPIPSRSRSPPLISSSSASSQQQRQRHQLTSSQQDDDNDDEDDDDGRPNGNNAYTSFNYYLKTPHSHVASGYNSQSRQSYIINQPTSNSRGRERGSSSTSSSSASSSGPNSSGSSPNAVATSAIQASTGRKVSSGSGPKTIVYSSTSTSSSSTQRPKTVVVVKATLPPSKSILKPKTLATPRTTTTTTPVPPPKYELDDQYDEYYDEEDYPLEQQQQPPSKPSTSSFKPSYQMPNNHPALISGSSSSRGGVGYDFRDGRSTKGVANAGQTIISTSTGRSPLDRSKLPIAITRAPKVTSKPVLVSPANIKVISSEFIGNNSTEEPYYYEDDYPDDNAFQQQQYGSGGYSSTSPSGPANTKPSSSSTATIRGSSGGLITARGSPLGIVKGTSNSGSNSGSSSIKGISRAQQEHINKMKQGAAVEILKEKDVSSSDYYDDADAERDHHFTHVDVPRIPFAKPNVPRVLVTNGKPFLPRLRRQSHYHNNFFASNNPFPLPPPQQQHSRQTSFIRDLLLPAAASSFPRPLQRSFPHNEYHHHHHRPGPLPPSSLGGNNNQMELRREARAKAIQWGRDPHPFR